MEAFDARDIALVSITQAFNTTSSMGRLMLNVLLSFAQFERELTYRATTAWRARGGALTARQSHLGPTRPNFPKSNNRRQPMSTAYTPGSWVVFRWVAALETDSSRDDTAAADRGHHEGFFSVPSVQIMFTQTVKSSRCS